MSTRYVHNGTSFVELGGAGGAASDQFPSALLNDGVATASSARTAVTATAHATPHTEGAWVEVDASLSAAASGIAISLVTTNTYLNGTNSSTLLEIGTGAGGSETVWAKIGVGFRPAERPPWIVPGAIPAGTRVAVRARSAITLQVVTAVYQFLPVKAVALGAPVTYLADTATSRGLTLTAPGSLNTKGAWTELVASTASALSVLAVTPQAAGASALHGSGVLIDIGVGAAAAEAVAISDIYLFGSSTEYYSPASPLTYGVDIPAGSRISARYAQANAVNDVDLILIGAPPA